MSRGEWEKVFQEARKTGQNMEKVIGLRGATSVVRVDSMTLVRALGVTNHVWLLQFARPMCALLGNLL